MRGRSILFAVGALLMAAGPAAAERVTLHSAPSAFQHLRVDEDRTARVRYLCNAACDFVHGEMALDGPFELRLEYMRSMLVSLAHLERAPRRMLFLGMGIGAMPRFLAVRYPQSHVDVVEIDSAVPPLARRFFGFPALANVTVRVAEGRAFLEAEGEPYDVVFVDACFGAEPPPRLITAEFIAALRRRLAPDGVVAVNVAPPALVPRFPGIVAGYRAAFATVELLATGNGANVVLIATDARPAESSVAARAAALVRRRSFRFDLPSLAAQRLPAWTCPAGALALHDSDLK